MPAGWECSSRRLVPNCGRAPLRALARIGVVGYPSMRVDHRFKDGDTIRLGPIALTAHITSGHTRGCTSWSFQVHDSSVSVAEVRRRYG
jgi:glyoxylase-like metal-dependent hydrolase (beta-lactamase superfamily II)